MQKKIRADVKLQFPDEKTARSFFERARWPKGPICPHCGSAEKNYALTPNKKARIREGLYKCGDCGDRFSVTVGTVMESSHVPLRKWLIAFIMMFDSDDGLSASQLQQQLGLGSYRTALFMRDRILHALSDGDPDRCHWMEETISLFDSTDSGENTFFIEDGRLHSLSEKTDCDAGVRASSISGQGITGVAHQERSHRMSNPRVGI